MLPATKTERDPRPEASAQHTPPARQPTVARQTRNRYALILLLVLVAALVLPPLISIGRYKRRVAASLSASLGRPVELGSVRLALLPRPGFTIHNLAIDELPQFGAEPLLQCGSVTASLRVLSLWRGRFEISRISFDEPSINLQRDAHGSWNFAPLLTQASQTESAPTEQQHPGRTLRFPYIEASGARINFKLGDEKTPFSLLNADTAVWLENANEWRLRFRAQPMRTDMNFSAADTGVVRVDGAVHRAATVGTLPLDLNAEWSKAPLGQISRLLTGEDAGWRADLDFRAHVTGTPDRLLLHTTARASDFHRAEFEPMQAMQLAATCDGVYTREGWTLDQLDCAAPVGSGSVRLTGNLAGPHSASASALAVEFTHAPANAFLELLRHVRRGFAQSTEANGEINGRFEWRGSGFSSNAVESGVLSGAARVTNASIRPPGVSTAISLPDLHWSAISASATGARAPQHAISRHPALVLQPAAVPMGAPVPLTVEGRLGAHEFVMHYAGSAVLARLLPISRAFGILPGPTAGLAPVGDVQLNLTLSGPWIVPVPETDSPQPPSLPSGTLSLHNARLQTPYVSTPLAIVSAQSSITPDEIAWSGISARLGAVPFTGYFRMPLRCVASDACARHFDLSTPALDIKTLRQALGGSGSAAFVREWLSRVDPHASSWPALEGTIRIAKLTLGALPAQNVTADMTIKNDRAEILALDGRALGGSFHATGAMSIAGTPSYTAHVQCTGTDARSLAELFGERWGNGVIDMDGDLRLKGTDAKALAQSAAGAVHWEWRGGGWPQLPDTPLAAFDQWTADGTVADGVITLTRGLLTSSKGPEPVNGTITLERRLDLQVGSDPSVTVAGTLAQPVLAAPRQADSP